MNAIMPQGCITLWWDVYLWFNPIQIKFIKCVEFVYKIVLRILMYNVAKPKYNLWFTQNAFLFIGNVLKWEKKFFHQTKRACKLSDT